MQRPTRTAVIRALTIALIVAAHAPDSWPADAEALRQRAIALESEGKSSDAIRMYLQAARAGSGKAAARLGEIYEKGLLGVQRDHAESAKWYNAARVLGENFKGGWGCPPKC